MKQEEFKKLLEGNRIGGTEEALKANIDNISNQFNEATEEDREGFFDSLFHSTRYDVMKAIVEQRIANEFELYNIALKCKIDDLRIGVDTESIPNKVHKAALDGLDKERIPEFYSSLVDQLLSDKESKILLPSTETLQALYEGLFVGGHEQALGKLHNFLGYYRGTEEQNSQELIAAVRANDQEKALKLISQGHYIYDFSKFNISNNSDRKLLEFIFLNALHHPNYNILAKDKDRRTPLHLAAEYGHTDAINAILEALKDSPELFKQVLSTDIYGSTPLHLAAIYKRTDAVKAILEALKDNPELLEQAFTPHFLSGNTPLHTAVSKGHIEIVKALLQAAKGNDELLKILCAPAYLGRTPLHLAAEYGHTDAVKAILEALKDNPALLRQTLAPNNNGKTPLDLANNAEAKTIIQEAIERERERERERESELCKPQALQQEPYLLLALHLQRLLQYQIYLQKYILTPQIHNNLNAVEILRI